jgi:hypothetical protein
MIPGFNRFVLDRMAETHGTRNSSSAFDRSQANPDPPKRSEADTNRIAAEAGHLPVACCHGRGPVIASCPSSIRGGEAAAGAFGRFSAIGSNAIPSSATCRDGITFEYRRRVTAQAMRGHKQRALPSSGCFLLEGVIGGTNQRTGFHVFETHLFAALFEIVKFVRADVPLDRQMLGRRL